MKTANLERETDEKKLKQRQKQIDIGKQSDSYKKYLALVPKSKRRFRGRIPVDPRTPDITQKCSKRGFDGQIKVWKRQIHALIEERTRAAAAAAGTGAGAGAPLLRAPQDPPAPAEAEPRADDLDYIFGASGLGATGTQEGQMGFFLDD